MAQQQTTDDNLFHVEQAIDGSDAGALIGRGGIVINRIRQESGAKVTISRYIRICFQHQESVELPNRIHKTTPLSKRIRQI